MPSRIVQTCIFTLETFRRIKLTPDVQETLIAEHIELADMSVAITKPEPVVTPFGHVGGSSEIRELDSSRL